MNGTAPTDQPALDRLLRFADLAIGASTVPLPVDLMPSALPQDVVEDSAAPQAETQTDAAVHVQPDAHAEVTPATGSDHAIPDDAVVNSLQAAVDAVHDSLQDDGPSISHASSLLVPDESQSGAMSATSIPGFVAADTADVPSHSDAGAATASLPEALPSFSAPQTLETTVHHTVQSVEAVVATATTLVADTANVLLGGAHGDGGAVTIPSLGGSGFDALAGLLHPAAAGPEPAQADPAVSLAHDAPVFAAIGVPDILHADDLAHAAHAPAHQVGNGLI